MRIEQIRIVTLKVAGDSTIFYVKSLCEDKDFHGPIRRCKTIEYSDDRRFVTLMYSVPGPEGPHEFRMTIPASQAIVTERFFPTIEVSDG